MLAFGHDSNSLLLSGGNAGRVCVPTGAAGAARAASHADVVR